MAEIVESEIIQGDTGPVWHIGVPNLTVDGEVSGYENLTTFSCVLVYTNGSTGAQVVKTVTDKNIAGDRFLVQFNSAESNVLAVGKNRIVIQVKDSAGIPYRSETQIDLAVRTQRYSEV